MKSLIATAFLLGVVFACSKNDEIKQDCSALVISDFEMVAYAGQDLGCNFYLVLYHFDQEQYFLLLNNCADMISYPFNCDRKRVCDVTGKWKCNRFNDAAVRIGVIGISESSNKSYMDFLLSSFPGIIQESAHSLVQSASDEERD